jgi:Rrf2 family protein
MLSQTSEYALRAVIYLARIPPGKLTSAEVIAEALGAPRNYLSKTLNTLAKRGFLTSTRGPAGGFRLNVQAHMLTLAEVIRAIDEPRTGRMCLIGGRACDHRHPCPVHFRWKDVTTEMWSPLTNTTIADLLDGADSDRLIAGLSTG